MDRRRLRILKKKEQNNMHHDMLQGTHYTAGFRWGALLRERGRILLREIPFAVTEERVDYARACLPVYQTYYPEVLEEIQGIADGQQCDAGILHAVLLSMYAMPPGRCCSCLAVAGEQGVFLGRNSDFLTALEHLNRNVIYRLEGAYALTGNTTAFVELEDGVNEHGLAAGLTSVYPLKKQLGLQAGLLLRYLLEKCRTVADALEHLRELPIASAMTLTLADPTGELAVVEAAAEGLAVGRPADFGGPFVCATNRFHLPGMERFRSPGLDDWFAEERYQTIMSALGEHGSACDCAFVQDLLAGRHGFLCQYDRDTGRDTVWSVVYDLRGKKVYRSEGNPGRRPFQEDSRFAFGEHGYLPR